MAKAFRFWPSAYLVVAALTTLVTWTVLRPHLYLTDGHPTAIDEFSPLGVAITNVLLIVLLWMVVGIAHLIFIFGVRSSQRQP